MVRMEHKKDHNTLKYVFVHGLSGWGSYDKANERMPYWGMRSSDLIAFLRKQGYDCFAASVSPTGSAWDRACELYAQITGTRVDYGEVHSKKKQHARFGRDFSSCPLIPEWNSRTRLVLLGHSFGGTTARLFSELLANGDPEERALKSADLSPLFTGGMGEQIHALVTLAAPMNGTTAYDLFSDPSFDPQRVHSPWWSGPFSRLMSIKTKGRDDSRNRTDSAGHDMHLDEAMKLNRRITTLGHVYYFSVPCSYTSPGADGSHSPRRGMEPLFVLRSCQIGAYSGRTAGGFDIGTEWRENDGLVNTVSASRPLGAPSVPLDKSRIIPGVWNVFPVYQGDHMSLQGGLFHRHEIRGFYLELLEMISRLQ